APWDGRTVPVQVLDRRIGTERLDAAHHYPDQDEVDEVRIAFRVPSVPGLGLASAGLAAGATAAGGARPPAEGALVKGRSLSNHWIEVALEPTGALTLHDRRSGQRFADLLRIEDGGDAGDTYTYCPPTGDRLARTTGPIKVRRLAAGPLVAALEARFDIGRRVGIRLVAILYADSPMVRCILDIDNHAGWPMSTPLAQCPGRSRLELAIAPISEAELERGDALPAFWEDAFLPLRGFWLRDAADLTPTPVDIALDGSGLVLSAVKPAQQGSPLVLRCYNATGRKAAGAWRFGEGVKSAHRVRADERESVALVLEG